MHPRLTAGLAALAALFLSASPADAGLSEYVNKADPEFTWKLKEKKESDAGTVYEIRLVSQKWQGIVWEHGLMVYHPKAAKPADTMLLLNTGGNPGGVFAVLGLELAKRVGTPVAVLFNVPKQPLFSGKTEDALIAETFVRFLDSGGKDEDWPLLLPMVKSVTRSMDALQVFSREHLKQDLKHFVVGGASKRGWTTWLTGAVDPRVKAIVPMVIDVLNMDVQMKHQVASFGKYSEMIRDYEDRNLLPAPDTVAARKLWAMVDPYAYRDRLTMPKLIVNGANDPYWTVDALNLYWDDLKGDKYAVIVPNAGHNLQQKFDDGKLDPLRAVSRAVNVIAAFTKSQIGGPDLPKVSWKHSDTNDGRLQVDVASSIPASGGVVWFAKSDTRDFRKAKWESVPASVDDQRRRIIGSVARPAKGWLAFYGEQDYERNGEKFTLSTQVRVVEAK